MSIKQNLKNLQAAARRRGLSLQKSSDRVTKAENGFLLVRLPNDGRSKPIAFEDLAEVRDELRSRPVEA